MRDRDRQSGGPTDGGMGWAILGYVGGSLLLVPAGVSFVLPAAASHSGVSLLLLSIFVTILWLLSLGVIGVYTLAAA